jgi:hypothetical protein
MVGGFRKLHKEELYKLYFLPNVIRMNKSKRTRWGGHGGHLGGEDECM